MNIRLYDSVEAAREQYPNYTSSEKTNKKIKKYDNTDYIKVGSIRVHHDTIWRVGRFFKTIWMIFPALYSKSYRELVSRSWKEFKRGEDTVSIYVKEQFFKPDKLSSKTVITQPLIDEKPMSPLELARTSGKNSAIFELIKSIPYDENQTSILRNLFNQLTLTEFYKYFSIAEYKEELRMACLQMLRSCTISSDPNKILPSYLHSLITLLNSKNFIINFNIVNVLQNCLLILCRSDNPNITNKLFSFINELKKTMRMKEIFTNEFNEYLTKVLTVEELKRLIESLASTERVIKPPSRVIDNYPLRKDPEEECKEYGSILSYLFKGYWYNTPTRQLNLCLDYYYEFEQKYPNESVYAFEGIILSYAALFKDMEDTLSSNGSVGLRRLMKIFRIRLSNIILNLNTIINHSINKEKIEKYLPKEFETFLSVLNWYATDTTNKKHDIVSAALGVLTMKNEPDHRKKLYLLLDVPRYMLPFLFIFLDLQDQKILIKELFARYQFRKKTDREWAERTQELLNEIYLILTPEELQCLELDPKEIAIMQNPLVLPNFMG